MTAFIVKYLAYAVSLLVALTLLSALIYFFKTPSNSRNWSIGNGKTAFISIIDNQITINNYRDADWKNLNLLSLKNDDQLFYEKQFELTDIQSINAVVSHFAILSEIAHIFILFNLKDGTQLGLSVEARKQKGEEYSLSGGLTAKFEIIYLLASYRDLVGLRLMRNESVYSYPIKATAEEAQALFKVVAERTNNVHENPELYHLFVKNCTTEIVKLVNQISDNEFPRLTQSFMPGDAGKALFKMDLIDSNERDFKAIQKASLLNK